MRFNGKTMFAMVGSVPAGAVSYEEQTLTPEQQAQARENTDSLGKNSLYTGYAAPANNDAKFWVNPNGNVGNKSIDDNDNISGIAGAFSAFLSGTAKRYDTITEALAEGDGKTDGTGKVLGYKIGGKLNIMLLDDIESSTAIAVNKDCTIHLNGHKIAFTSASAYLNCAKGSRVTINGTVTGSEVTNVAGYLVISQGDQLNLVGGAYTIYGTSDSGVVAILSLAPISMDGCLLQIGIDSTGDVYGLQATNKVTINGCFFDITGQGDTIINKTAMAIKTVAQDYTMDVQNSTINIKANRIYTYGIMTGSKHCDLKNCTISAVAPVIGTNIIGATVNSDMAGIGLTIENCKIYADGHADVSKAADNSGYMYAVAVHAKSNAILAINGGDYWGAREALVVHSQTRINGGIFKGCGHGGAYLSGEDIKVKNAIFRNVEYTGECGWDEPNPDGTQNFHGGACYCGSGSNATNVWFDNCQFDAEAGVNHILAAKYTNTTVYISNSKLADHVNQLRADAMDIIYVGKNVNDGVYTTYVENGGVVDSETYANEEFGFETETTTDKAILCVKDERGNWVAVC